MWIWFFDSESWEKGHSRFSLSVNDPKDFSSQNVTELQERKLDLELWSKEHQKTNKQNKPHFPSDSDSNVIYQDTLKFLPLFCSWFGDSRSFKVASWFGPPIYMRTLWYYTGSFTNHFVHGPYGPCTPATCPCLYLGCGSASAILIPQQRLARLCGAKDF